MDHQLIYKKIDNCFEIRKNLWTTIIVLTAGLAGLLLNLTDLKVDISYFVKVILFILGVIMDIFLFINLSDCNKDINFLINKLEEG